MDCLAEQLLIIRAVLAVQCDLCQCLCKLLQGFSVAPLLLVYSSMREAALRLKQFTFSLFLRVVGDQVVENEHGLRVEVAGLLERVFVLRACDCQLCLFDHLPDVIELVFV